MVMQADHSKGSIGKTNKSNAVGVGGRQYPSQIGKSCSQQAPGATPGRAKTGGMSWGGHKK